MMMMIKLICTDTKATGIRQYRAIQLNSTSISELRLYAYVSITRSKLIYKFVTLKDKIIQGPLGLYQIKSNQILLVT